MKIVHKVLWKLQVINKLSKDPKNSNIKDKLKLMNTLTIRLKWIKKKDETNYKLQLPKTDTNKREGIYVYMCGCVCVCVYVCVCVCVWTEK